MTNSNNEIRALSLEEMDAVAGGYTMDEFKSDVVGVIHNFVEGFKAGAAGAKEVLKAAA